MNNETLQPGCAAIPVKPPWILAAGGLAGIGLHALFRWKYTADPAVEQWLDWIGYAVAVAGGLLLFLADRQFRRHGTDSDCGVPDTALIMTGPYRFSRNPIYVSFAVIFVGCSLSANAPMLALIVVPMLWALHRFVVLPEEVHLEALFDQKYRGYAGRVRRWL